MGVYNSFCWQYGCGQGILDYTDDRDRAVKGRTKAVQYYVDKAMEDGLINILKMFPSARFVRVKIIHEDGSTEEYKGQKSVYNEKIQK